MADAVSGLSRKPMRLTRCLVKLPVVCHPWFALTVQRCVIRSLPLPAPAVTFPLHWRTLERRLWTLAMSTVLAVVATCSAAAAAEPLQPCRRVQ